MLKSKLIIFFIVINSSMSLVFADDCARILKSGVFDKNSHLDTYSQYEMVSKIYCGNRKTSTGVTIPLEVPVNLSHDDINKFCENNTSQVNISSNQSSFVKKASTAIIQGWLQCRRESSGSIHYFIPTNDPKIFYYRLEFLAGHGVSSTNITSISVNPTNACKVKKYIGQTLTHKQSITVICNRRNAGKLVHINASTSTLGYNLEPIEMPIKIRIPTPVVQECRRVTDTINDNGWPDSRFQGDFNNDGCNDFCRLIGNRPGPQNLFCDFGARGTKRQTSSLSVIHDPGWPNTIKYYDANNDGFTDFCRGTGNNRPGNMNCLLNRNGHVSR